jgi:PIN domain nuclease of toxin-antitoxin system
MRVLIDTHVFIWWTGASNQLSPLVRDTLTDPQTKVILSIASVWEMQIKVSLGKLSFKTAFPDLVNDEISRNRISLLPIDLRHIYDLHKLPLHHRDPFVGVASPSGESIVDCSVHARKIDSYQYR